MNRPKGSGIENKLSVFYIQKVGCMLWGLVNGKTQTHLPWGHRPGDPPPTVWQHDLYYGNFQPYRSNELDSLKHYIKLSKTKDYAQQLLSQLQNQ